MCDWPTQIDVNDALLNLNWNQNLDLNQMNCHGNSLWRM